MKDFIQIWNRMAGKSYAAVNTNADREMRDLSNNRLKRGDVDTSTFEANLAECEGLNAKFSEDCADFSGRKDAIINRLFERRKKGQVARHPKNLFIILMLGFFGLAAGCFILVFHPYDILFRLKVVLSEGGEIYEMWRKPEVNLYTRIYLFNVTNAEEFMAGNDTKLKLQEVGPYVYKEQLEHTNVTFNENGTLSSVPVHPLTWVEELSEGRREDDILVLPHIALLSIAHVGAKSNIFTRLGLNALIGSTRSQPLVSMTAKEFMFGFESSLLTLGNSFMPDWIKFDKLGLIDRMYDFEGDYETIYTGEDDVRLSGLIDTYRGSEDLPQWNGHHCSAVRYASDGTKFRGGLSKNDTVLFFRKSMCRAAPLMATDEGVKSGLRAYKYTFPDDLLDNGKVNPNNKCFCRKGLCLPDGMIDVTDCYYGFPIALSYPHFYKGEERLFRDVEGLHPNKEQHETRFWIQPESGLPVDVSTKFQINMALGDTSKITNVEKFADMYLPLLWFDIRLYELPKSMADRFNLYLNVLPAVEQAAMYILFLTGAALVILAVYRLAFKIMFKTFDSDTKKHKNIILASTEHWIDGKTRKNNKRNTKNDAFSQSEIYAPCEIPLNDDAGSKFLEDSNSDEDVKINMERRHSGFVKTHGDRIKELGIKLGDRVHDSVGSVKGILKGEITHVKNIFENQEHRRGSLIPPPEKTPIEISNVNDGYKSDTDESNEDTKYITRLGGTSYEMVGSSDSDDDCRYLEVLDDGSQFDEMRARGAMDRRRSKDIQVKRLNDLDDGLSLDEDLIIRLSDLRDAQV